MQSILFFKGNISSSRTSIAFETILESFLEQTARYRKEVTGALNDEQLRNLDERLKYLRNLEDRKAQVLASIEEQGLQPNLNNIYIIGIFIIIIEETVN